MAGQRSGFDPPQVLLPSQLEWVGNLRSAADVTPKPGFFKKMVKKIVGLDDRDRAMLMPYGIAVDSQGRVLVVDTRERQVHVFDAEKKKYKTFHAPDREPFAAPIAIDTDADGKIYVSDSVGRASRFLAGFQIDSNLGRDQQRRKHLQTLHRPFYR